MASISKLEVEIRSVTRYCFIFFPIATFTRIGEVELLTFLGIHIYSKVGDIKNILGYTFSTDRKEEINHD